MGQSDGQFWYAAPFRSSTFTKGCCVVCLEEPVPASSTTGFFELLAAFAEVAATRQAAELESFLDDFWQPIQATCLEIGNTKSSDEAATLLASSLASALRAARVSVMAPNSRRSLDVLAVSGVPLANSRSATLRSILAIGQEVQSSTQPILRQQSHAQTPTEEPRPEIREDGLFANLLCLRLTSSAASSVEPAVVLFEFADTSALISSATKLPQLLPAVALAWEQQQRWLRVPSTVRKLLAGPVRLATIWLPTIKWMLALGLLGLTIWMLVRPAPLIIEADGIYEPVVARTIYATDDGFVDELLVDDGQSVLAGQSLARLRSPALELKISQATGEIRALEEEASGIRIALNQLAAESASVLGDQSRLAAKISELELKKINLQQQLALLSQQSDRLSLVAPIAGCVVARDLKQRLAGRPVRRGDPLFTIVDLDGPWHIRVHVADRDTGYVTANYGHTEPKNTDMGDTDMGNKAKDRQSHGLEYSLDSAPSQRYVAHLTWMADQVENKPGEGCYLELRAGSSVAAEANLPTGTQAGAGVRAFFECGQQPLWFVWSRPIVEAVQRRWWFRSEATHE